MHFVKVKYSGALSVQRSCGFLFLVPPAAGLLDYMCLFTVQSVRPSLIQKTISVVFQLFQPLASSLNRTGPRAPYHYQMMISIDLSF